MSKIYEALLRAEIERLAAAGTEKEEVPATAASSLAGPPQAPRQPWQPLPHHPAQDATQSTAVEGPTAVEAMPAVDAEGLADLAGIPIVTWRPSLLQLPALQERGAAVEQFRGLRSRMQEFRGLNVLKSVMVSSGLPEEGKSFITVNLAISMARYKASRVLLIDGDMRRGTLHKLLGAPNERGLAEYLSGQASLPEVMQRAKPVTPGDVMPEGLATLTFIPCGAGADNAADLSGNGRFEKLLAAATPFFDWIVIDSSPVNLVADGANLGRACDGVLLVTRGGVTKFTTAQRAVDELKASKVIGVILNAVEKPPTVGGYYGYDSYDKISQ